MQNERLTISWGWFRDHWCNPSMCDYRNHCSRKNCRPWGELVAENKAYRKHLEKHLLPRYTAQRCRIRTETKYGSIHYAEDDFTLCGEEIGEGWWILTTDRDGVATCKKCLAEYKKSLNE